MNTVRTMHSLILRNCDSPPLQQSGGQDGEERFLEYRAGTAVWSLQLYRARSVSGFRSDGAAGPGATD
jgi:hypothetical protein